MRVLVRASGARLLHFGITDVLPHPMLTLHAGNGDVVANNNGWLTLPAATQTEITTQLTEFGAEPLDPTGAEAALLVDLEPGLYSVVVQDSAGRSGVVIAELFSATNIDNDCVTPK
jgi:hypothetical protein